MAVAELERESLSTVKEESLLTVVFRRFLKHKLAVAGMFVVVIFVLAALFAPIVAPFDPYKQNLGPAYGNPSAQHWLGTDELGRDVFSRLVYAARLSLFITLIVNFTTETTGTIIGAISGYFGGWVDSAIQRFVELLISIPTLPLLLFFSAMLRGITIPGLPD